MIADPFTQIMWKDTTYVGLSLFVKEISYGLVAIYHPPGNISGQYEAIAQALKEPFDI